ncbi:hypothetical protein V6N12_000358 [Hibiscus sabdariffa]|uniref:Uncharacterized protein n=1 Tax=Hibiscus sabdariffa TaxID=183260 RepID=A0ABR2B7U1_9ROSI
MESCLGWLELMAGQQGRLHTAWFCMASWNRCRRLHETGTAACRLGPPCHLKVARSCLAAFPACLPRLVLHQSGMDDDIHLLDVDDVEVVMADANERNGLDVEDDVWNATIARLRSGNTQPVWGYVGPQTEQSIPSYTAYEPPTSMYDMDYTTMRDREHEARVFGCSSSSNYGELSNSHRIFLDEYYGSKAQPHPKMFYIEAHFLECKPLLLDPHTAAK